MARSRRAMLGGLGAAASVGVLGTALGGSGTGADGATTGSVDALVAGSLLAFADDLPGATVEAHGSAGVSRLVRSGARDPDVVALADPRLFDGVAEAATLFATNALVLTCDPGATAADAPDWRAALDAADGIGRTDPDVDPLGYRTVMALSLAADHHGVEAEALLARSAVFRETGLLNAVEGGGVDLAVTYRNMAVQRGLPYHPLPSTLDFSDPAHTDTYASASYDLGDRTVEGRPIRYGAAGLTPAGVEWTTRLTTATDRLESAGFAVPDGYPERGWTVPAQG